MDLRIFLKESLKIAQKVIDAFADDFLEEKWFKETVYEHPSEQREKIERLLNE